MMKDFKSDILVVGEGRCAHHVAADLAAQGIAVHLATADEGPEAPDDHMTLWSGSRLVACSGHAGAFQVTLAQARRRIFGQVAAIVVAGNQARTPNPGAFGLEPGDRVWTADDLAQALASGVIDRNLPDGARVVFLNGWQHDTHPVTAARMLSLCLRLQQQGTVGTAYLAGNLKVAVDGMEACSEAAKAAGTLFFKFTESSPRLETLADGRVRIDYRDEASRMDFRLSADYVIVDERIGPDPAVRHLADVLRLTLDPFGFAQTDNVHRMGNATNRRGIFVADAARGILSVPEQRADAAHVVLKATEFLAGLDRNPLPKVEIDQGRCARCLTCYRLCPHGAVDLAPRMTVVPEACQGCGVCVAGCPNRAIRIDDAELVSALGAMVEQPGTSRAGEGFTPRIVLFCCERSAVPARRWALAMGHQLPPGLMLVEGLCGGTFSVHHLLQAFEAQVDGVMVLTCHPGNCHSEEGTRHAQQRSAEAAKALASAGVGEERIQYSTLAANMGSEFAQRVNAFAARMATLGPLGGSIRDLDGRERTPAAAQPNRKPLRQEL